MCRAGWKSAGRARVKKSKIKKTQAVQRKVKFKALPSPPSIRMKLVAIFCGKYLDSTLPRCGLGWAMSNEHPWYQCDVPDINQWCWGKRGRQRTFNRVTAVVGQCTGKTVWRVGQSGYGTWTIQGESVSKRPNSGISKKIDLHRSLYHIYLSWNIISSTINISYFCQFN